MIAQASLPPVSWVAIAPELALAIGAALVLLVDVQWKPRARVLGWVAGAMVLLAFGLAIWQKSEVADILSTGAADPAFLDRFTPFQGMLALDPGAVMARFIILIVTGLGIGAGWRLFESLGRRAAEALALMLLSAAGFSLMAASLHLVMMFLGLEIGSIALYVLAGITRERAQSDEAAIKYFLLGSVASAVFIYGVALIYAGTGRLNLGEIQVYLGEIILTRPAVLLMGLALVVVGLAFKVSAAPFHAWAPDVYQGAPAGVVGFMASVAKVGGFAALIRVLLTAFPGLAGDWRPLVAGIAALSMVVGAVVAVAQTDVRRMLAYSGVAHAGFILSGLVAGGPGAGAMWFYLAVYTLQLVGAFGVVAAVSGAGASGSDLAAYAGLARRSPQLAVSLAVFLLGMSGVPLTSGFIAKFGVFQQVWIAGYEWLVVLALLSSVVAFFFYLRVIVRMFMEEGDDLVQPGVPVVARTVLVGAALATIALGVLPGYLLDLARDTLPL
jgi:NADH-quinone oxidoreductase subunit N